MKRTYSRYFARDFTLPLIETWAKAETTDPRQWTKKANPELPFEIFIRENDMVTDYFNPKGLDWINGELKRLMKKDKKFAEQAVGEFNKRAKLIKPVWEKKKTLDTISCHCKHAFLGLLRMLVESHHRKRDEHCDKRGGINDESPTYSRAHNQSARNAGADELGRLDHGCVDRDSGYELLFRAHRFVDKYLSSR
jgi:hypothetical protein